MTTMADLVRRECACGTVWFQGIEEPKANECNECFIRRVTMTTVQVNNEFDQTAPQEVNGHTVVETVAAAPKRTRKTKDEDKQPGPSVLEQLRELQERTEALRSQAVDELRARRVDLLKEIQNIDMNLGELGSSIPMNADGTVTLIGNAVPRKRASVKERRAISPKRHRRSAAEIQECVDKVVALVKKSKEGLGAQKIRERLGLEAKEMPKILKTALADKLLKSKGQKRATVYSAR